VTPNVLAVQRRRVSAVRCKRGLGGDLTSRQQLVDSETNVPRDLAEKRGRDISRAVEWHRRATAIRMTELLVRTALPDLGEPVREQQCHDFARLQNWDAAHSQATWMVRTSTNSDSRFGSPSSRSISMTSRRFC
jgi:hypothetical protein